MRAGLAMLAMLAAAPAWGQSIDLSKGGPIEVTASDGLEWRQNELVVLARGNARAVRGGVTVTADTLTAHYRKKAPVAGAAAAPAIPAAIPGAGDTGSSEVYRLEAQGNVHIFTATDLAVGDHAVYDIDQAVLLLTGKALKITTPQDVMTARDTMEYWSQKHMAVGRGLASVTTADGRRLDGDVLVGYTTPPEAAPAGTAVRPAGAPKPAGDAISASGKLQRVEAFGNVEVRTATETIRGSRGVYVADTEMARIAGNVHITRGLNQLNGDEALVNMRTGISTLVRDPGGRVQGLMVPNDPSLNNGRGTPAPPASPPPVRR